MLSTVLDTNAMVTNTFEFINSRHLFQYFSFAESCLKVSCRKSMSRVIENVRLFFNFEKAVCVLTEIAKGSLPSLLEMLNVSYPEEWLKLYNENAYHTIDPILIRHFRDFKPQIWSETYRRTPPVNKQFIEIAKDFGLRNGVSHGIRDDLTSQASLFSFSGVSPKSHQSDVIQLKMVIPLLHIALSKYYKHQKKLDLMAERKKCQPLTEREKEVLNWLKLGKTNWEISMILGISERTVKFHVINILRKLNTSTRCYAVAKAIHLSIISL